MNSVGGLLVAVTLAAICSSVDGIFGFGLNIGLPDCKTGIFGGLFKGGVHASAGAAAGMAAGAAGRLVAGAGGGAGGRLTAGGGGGGSFQARIPVPSFHVNVGGGASASGRYTASQPPSDDGPRPYHIYINRPRPRPPHRPPPPPTTQPPPPPTTTTTTTTTAQPVKIVYVMQPSGSRGDGGASVEGEFQEAYEGDFQQGYQGEYTGGKLTQFVGGQGAANEGGVRMRGEGMGRGEMGGAGMGYSGGGIGFGGMSGGGMGGAGMSGVGFGGGGFDGTGMSGGAMGGGVMGGGVMGGGAMGGGGMEVGGGAGMQGQQSGVGQYPFGAHFPYIPGASGGAHLQHGYMANMNFGGYGMYPGIYGHLSGMDTDVKNEVINNNYNYNTGSQSDVDLTAEGNTGNKESQKPVKGNAGLQIGGQRGNAVD